MQADVQLGDNLRGILTAFDTISNNSRATSKSLEALQRRHDSLEAHTARNQTEHARLAEENERLARLVKEQSVTIKTLREELSASAAAVATTATQGTELCKARSESTKLRSAYDMVIDQKENIAKELEEVRGRLTVADQEIRSLRSQTRGIVSTR